MSNGLEPRVERIESLLEQTAQMQITTQRQLEQLGEKVDQTSTRLDEFIFQAQRLFTQQAERMNRVESQIERTEAIVTRLDRNYEASRAELSEFRITTNAALERIDRILDYLMQQSS